MIAVQQLTKKLSLNQIKNAEQVLLGQAQKKPVRQKVDSRKVGSIDTKDFLRKILLAEPQFNAGGHE